MPSFETSDEDLMKVLAAHVKRHDWFSYNEPTPRGVKKAASDHNKLIEARAWLEGMRQVHDTLSFRKKQIHNVLTRIFDENNQGWRPKVKPEPNPLD